MNNKNHLYRIRMVEEIISVIKGRIIETEKTERQTMSEIFRFIFIQNINTYFFIVVLFYDYWINLNYIRRMAGGWWQRHRSHLICYGIHYQNINKWKRKKIIMNKHKKGNWKLTFISLFLWFTALYTLWRIIWIFKYNFVNSYRFCCKNLLNIIIFFK